MKFAQNVVVAVGVAETGEGAHAYELLPQMTFLNQSRVHFVHVFRTVLYATALGPTLSYPGSAEKDQIEESVFQYLKHTFTSVLPDSFEGQAHFVCLFGEDPKQAMIRYITEVQGDLIIVASRKERGIFESSFAQYVSKHTLADVLILKLRDETKS